MKKEPFFGWMASLSAIMACLWLSKIAERDKLEQRNEVGRDKVRVENNYVLPRTPYGDLRKVGIIKYFRGLVGTDPITLAVYNGTNYFFKVNTNGIPYFEPIKGLESGVQE